MFYSTCISCHIVSFKSFNLLRLSQCQNLNFNRIQMQIDSSRLIQQKQSLVIEHLNRVWVFQCYHIDLSTWYSKSIDSLILLKNVPLSIFYFRWSSSSLQGLRSPASMHWAGGRVHP